ncbi:hypothetical protein GCM10027418_07890 [Mariniluteicoccus endophyticus]
MMPTTPIAYDPSVVEERLSNQRRRIIGSAAGILTPLVIGALMTGYFFTLGRGQMPDGALESLWTIAGIGSAISVLLTIAYALWRWRTTRLRVAPGLAMQLSPLGIEVEQAQIPWSAVTRMDTVWSRTGEGHLLRISHTGGPPVELPFESLGIKPGSLDSAVRAYSDGRVSIDLSAFGA